MSCPEMDLGEFGKRLREGLGGKRYPLSGTIELTERCNLDCVHCYINQPAGSAEHRQRELTTAQWKDVLDQIAAEGCLYLLITGGEPLLRPDFLEIYDHAKRKGFIITLFTNGTLMTPEIADHLAEWHPYVVEITLYGATAETYERVTGVPGSFERCHRGIRLLRERGIPLRLKTVVMTLNVHEFDQIRDYVQRELEMEFRFDGTLWPRPDGAKCPADLRVAPERLVEIALSDARSVPEWQRLIERHKQVSPHEDIETLYRCGAGLMSFKIGPYGELGLCVSSGEPFYSLVTGDFATGWHMRLRDARMREATKPLQCRSCELASLCGYCPVFARLENGDSESVVEFACQIAHLEAWHTRKALEVTL